MKEILRPLVGSARYRFGATLQDAPKIVNCWVLAQWAYRQQGIFLPDFPREQLTYGLVRGWALQFHELDTAEALIFVDGIQSGRLHVGIATGEGSVIHATNSRFASGVLEVSISEFLSASALRGAWSKKSK